MSDRIIKECIEKLSGKSLTDQISMHLCSVDTVDADARTCDVTTLGGLSIPGVLLMSEVDDGFFLLPGIGSTVIVQFSTRVPAFVLMFGNIDKVVFSSINGVQFNDGKLGGLVRVMDLITKLNNLENAYNDLAAKFNSHTHLLTLTSGTGTAAPTAAPEATSLTPTQQSEIENTNITHGN